MFSLAPTVVCFLLDFHVFGWTTPSAVYTWSISLIYITRWLSEAFQFIIPHKNGNLSEKCYVLPSLLKQNTWNITYSSLNNSQLPLWNSVAIPWGNALMDYSGFWTLSPGLLCFLSFLNCFMLSLPILLLTTSFHCCQCDYNHCHPPHTHTHIHTQTHTYLFWHPQTHSNPGLFCGPGNKVI